MAAANTSLFPNYCEVVLPPDDSVSSITFCSSCTSQILMVAGSWDSSVRCWDVESPANAIPKSMQKMEGPVLDVCGSNDGTSVFIAGTDCTVKWWDLITNQIQQIGTHEAPVKTCHWIRSPTYSCLMTGSWDKSLKFWDLRSPQAIRTVCLPERCYCADVDYPMAVVGTADKNIIVYQLEGGPQEYTRLDSLLKLEIRSLAIFRSRDCRPAGVAVGGVEGKVSVLYVHQPNCNYTFRCHRTEPAPDCEDIFAINGIAFHRVQGTLVTVGSDGRFIFWDMDARTRLMASDFMEQSITTCAISNNGQLFAYSIGYDWSKGHEYNDPTKKISILLMPCSDEMKTTSNRRYKI